MTVLDRLLPTPVAPEVIQTFDRLAVTYGIRLPVAADRGDTSQTLTVGTDSPYQRWNTTLTADRTVTLSTTGAVSGDGWFVSRTGGGAFTLTVGSYVLRPNEWVEHRYDGSAYVVVRAGSLEVGHEVVDGWYQDNVAATQTDVELTRAAGRWVAVRAGSVTGIVVKSTEARTAGTLTVEVFKNTGLAGAAGSQLGTLSAVLDGTNTSAKATTQARGTDTFAAGDELYLVVTTDGSWTPTTADIRCALEITPE